MKICLSVLGEVKVDDYVDSLNVNTSGEEIYRKVTEVISVAQHHRHPALKHCCINRNSPVQTRFLHRPFLKSWKTRFLYS